MSDHHDLTADFTAFAEQLGNVGKDSAAVQYFARGIASLEAKAQTGELPPSAYQEALQAHLDQSKTELVLERMTPAQKAVADKFRMTYAEYARSWRETQGV